MDQRSRSLGGNELTERRMDSTGRARETTQQRTDVAGTPPEAPRGLHLVGSIPLSNAEEVFRTAATSLGDWLWRLPDGETGPRGDWIVWQYPLFSSRPQFEICPPRGDQYRALPRLRIRDTERVE